MSRSHSTGRRRRGRPATTDACERAPQDTRSRLDRILDRYRGASAQPFGYASLLTAALHAGAQGCHVKLRGPDPRAPAIVEVRDRLARVRLDHALALSWSFAHAAEAGVIACRQMTCVAIAMDADAVEAAVRVPPSLV